MLKMHKKSKKKKSGFFVWIKNLFVNPDKKPKPKKDWIKWLARRHYLNKFLLIVILDLTLLISIGFNFKLWYVSIPLIIVSVPFGFFTAWALLDLIKNSAYIAFVKKHNNDILTQKSRVDFRKGPPGCGKSTQTLYEAVILAEKCWEELTYKYWLYKGIDEKKLSEFQLNEKSEVIEAYEFYQREGTIPCLWTNVPCKDDKGRRSNRLTKDHLLQKEKLPYLSALFSDEIGIEFEAQKGKVDKELKNLSLFGRLIRHFTNGFWRLTEQDEKKSFIDIRRVVERVVLCLSQVWVMEPKILNKFYKKLVAKRVKQTNKIYEYKENSKTYNKLQKGVYKSSKKHSLFMKRLKHYIKCVGFRKYTVEERETNESDGQIIYSKLKTFYTPSCLNVNYNDRCFHNLYKCKDKKLKPSRFTCDHLTDEDADLMLKENK
ncbi:MAG: hypothetical protein ACI4TI_02390 [Christensenellales bacterium]